jgi:hypothetical protein
MPKFSNIRDLEKHLKRATDALLTEVIVTTQGRLGSAAISPIKDGRLRSSWFASEGSPSSEVPPEGANSPNTDAASLKVDSDKKYFLSSSLPYTQEVAIAGHVVSKPVNWFIDEMYVGLPKTAEKAAEVVKKRFDLGR